MIRRLWIHGFPGIIFFLAFLFAAEKILFHLDLLNIDVGGHFASAVSTLRGQFHRFNDQFFAGYIHGLFYPPLEDWILSFWFRLCSRVSVELYQGYSYFLCAVFGAYLFSQWRFVMALRPGFSRNFLAAFFVFLDLVPKGGEISLQGLSLYDFWNTGLTSQVLSGVFFFWFLGRILRGDQWIGTLVAFSLTFLSHIVMGLSAALILAFVFVFVRERRREAWLIALWGAGMSAFFWVPFLSHRNFLENTNVFSSEHPCWSFSILSMGLLFLQWRSELNRALLSFCTAVFLCQGLLPLFIQWSPLGIQQWAPAFHYYRLGVLGVFILGIVIARLDFRIARLAIPGLLICLGLNFQNFSYGASKASHSPVLDLRESGDLSFDQFGRYWVIGQRRTIDFGLDTLLASELPDFKSNKGLYWESSKSNTLLSSYLTTLLKAPSILQYFFFANYPCPVLGCVLDSYFRTFNIRGVIGDPMRTAYGLSSLQVQCYRDIFEKGTPLYQIQKTGLIRSYGEEFPVYRLKPKNTGQQDRLALVERLSALDLGHLKKRYRGFQAWEQQAMIAAFHPCYDHPNVSHPMTIWVKDEDWSQIDSIVRSGKVDDSKILAGSSLIPVNKENQGKYSISLPESQDPSFYVIKLSAQPGMRITGADGSMVPFWSSYPHTLIFAKGRVLLEFVETLPMKFGFWISIGSVTALIFLWFFLRIRPVFQFRIAEKLKKSC